MQALPPSWPGCTTYPRDYEGLRLAEMALQTVENDAAVVPDRETGVSIMLHIMVLAAKTREMSTLDVRRLHV